MVPVLESFLRLQKRYMQSRKQSRACRWLGLRFSRLQAFLTRAVLSRLPRSSPTVRSATAQTCSLQLPVVCLAELQALVQAAPLTAACVPLPPSAPPKRAPSTVRFSCPRSALLSFKLLPPELLSHRSSTASFSCPKSCKVADFKTLH